MKFIMKKFYLIPLLIMVMLWINGRAEAAQKPSAPAAANTAGGPAAGLDVRATAQETLSMDFDVTRLDFGFVSPAASPYEIKRALTVTLRANQNWVLNVVANDDLRSGTGLIPINQLKWRRTGTDYQSFSRTSSSIMAQGGPTSNEGIKLIYDMLLIINWPDPPGTYNTSITFTLSSKP